MILAHKIQLYPTCKQASQLQRAAGCARYTWNWALAEADKHYKATGKTVNFNELKKRWNKEKPVWIKESPKDANQQAFTNLKQAFQRFFKRTSRRPVFKSRHKHKNSFYISNDKFHIADGRVHIPKVGWVKLTEKLRFEGKITSATVSKTADRWFISVSVRVKTEPNPGGEIIGIDLGLKHFATLSNGEVLEAPKPLKKNLKTLARRNRQHSRKQKKSKNKEKSRMRLARLHAKISNIRKDFLHKTTSSLVARTKLLIIEDLSVAGMSKLWGRAVNDLGLYEFRRQLTYKCEKAGVGLLLVDRWFPSSQLCSCCGGRQKLGLNERVYACPVCGLTLDRDSNAANNLYTVGLAEINAWGHEGSGNRHVLVVKPEWMNQELNPCSLESTT